MTISTLRQDFHASPGHDDKWRAIFERDASFDGKFFYGVATTGVYCRPSCASRQPLRENVHFFDSADEAADAGFRPCKRCRPDRRETIRFATAKCSLGCILVAATARGVCAIVLGDDPDALRRWFQEDFANAEPAGDDRGFKQLVARVAGFVEAPDGGLDLPLDIRGTAFQQRVWAALGQIPPGETASYADIAAAIGSPRSARAVARACADNHLAVAVPCHRVIRSDGSLSGYRWGVDRKRIILEREALKAPASITGAANAR